MTVIQIQQKENTYILRIPKGDEVMRALKEFCEEKNIRAGYFSGIGAVSEGDIGPFLPDKREYEHQPFSGNAELLSLLGNVAKDDEGKVFIHAHAVLSNPDGAAFGGHVFRLTVSATVEIILQSVGQSLVRKLDPDIGLKLLQPES